MKALIIVAGVTGNLALKKLIPAYYRLLKNHDLKIIGIGRRGLSKNKILSDSKDYITNFDKSLFAKLKNNFFYHKTDFYDDEGFKRLNALISEHARNYHQVIFHFATLPKHFVMLSKQIKKCGILKGFKQKKLVFEKPFGYDYKSAKQIDRTLKRIFKEEEIFRIDHYLGKELIENITVFRFTNTFLEPVWNNRYVDHVQIILSEDFGIEGRANFYEHFGALKDVVQNHMLQMLTLTTMEKPKSIVDVDCLKKEKLKILKNIKTTRDVVIGQYKGYRKEVKNKSSMTETFVALKLFIQNKRWKGVPFYFITGKKMKDKLTSIFVQFKQLDCDAVKKICDYGANYANIQIYPNGGFYMKMNAKQPNSSKIIPTKLSFCHSCIYGINTPEAYENLYNDMFNNKKTMFVSKEEIEEAWKIVERINIKKLNLEQYKPGTYPKSALTMIKKDNREWHLEVENVL
ncbi:glucose-6-phosphate dehydrogenase [Candidatus Woesearchaeota archaeon]|nr:MAG: glucose-6-phosphate dehydrogenase [Candidatus Woesearchaeota archaeon]